MSAIGISPCPPFTHPPREPGVLYDGNTVAWFKHNDMRTIIQDGANRVSFWLDRAGYGIGVEMVNQATWYTAAYWDTFDANWSQVATHLHSDGNNGFTGKNNFWVIGNTYKIVITVANLIAGDFYIYDGVTVPINIIASGTYTIYYTPGTVDLYFRSLLLLSDITALSIKRITGNHLLQAVGASQPFWSAANGILFDGVNDFMKCIPFAFVQPEFVYFVGRQVTWSFVDRVYDGNTNTSMLISQADVTPEIVPYAGNPCTSQNTFVVNTFGILRVYYNGINSFLQINLNAPVVEDFGANNANGFTLGSISNGLSQWTNIEVKEIILRCTADNAAVQLQIYNYLRNANAIP